MRIITFGILRDFIRDQPDADIALREWYAKNKKSKWSGLSDVIKTLNHAEYVKNDRFVFNIRGNKYRLVALIIFKSQKVYIRFIGTHKDYDKIDCTNI